MLDSLSLTVKNKYFSGSTLLLPSNFKFLARMMTEVAKLGIVFQSQKV